MRFVLRGITSFSFMISFFFPWFRYAKVCSDIASAEMCGKPIAVYPFWSILEGGTRKYVTGFEPVAIAALIVFVILLTIFLNAIRKKEREKEKTYIAVTAIAGIIGSIESFILQLSGPPYAIGSWIGLISSLILVVTLFSKKKSSS